tara:strand:+ start:949 stop:1134 length:186 start_codon:yes stop_codon:yes gene_type:complete
MAIVFRNTLAVILSWRTSKGKVVLNNGGVYLSLTMDEIGQLELVLEDIKTDEREFYEEDNR